MMKALTHVNGQGQISMVDVSGKKCQRRTARAVGSILLSAEAIKLIQKNLVKKGDVLTTAKIAGIQAAKQTASLIPLCHPLQIEKIDISLSLTKKGINAESLVRCTGRTGVEMEAMVGVSIALLTIYDMCKAVDKQMVISEIKLVEKIKEDVK